MNNVRSFMVLAAVFFLFIGACTYAANVVQAIDKGTQLAYNLNVENDRKVKAELNIPGEESYSGAQVAYMIRNMADDDADIEVNGVSYSRFSDHETMDPAVVDLNKTYRATYNRDASGYLIKIVFRG